jgi:regulator of replication initiation timing
MSKVTDIASILPEGLSESTVQKIFELVDETINEQVEKQVEILEAKVNAFLRTKIERLKEHALAELAEENEIFRNARLFESVRTLMALELSGDDEQSALSEMTTQAQELQEETDVLTEQLNQLVLENQKLSGTIKTLSDQVAIQESTVGGLESEKEQLQEEVENLKAIQDEAFHTSEKAIVISQADKEITEERVHHSNEFLTDEVMSFMPHN